jgi:hypothetical protein
VCVILFPFSHLRRKDKKAPLLSLSIRLHTWSEPNNFSLIIFEYENKPRRFMAGIKNNLLAQGKQTRKKFTWRSVEQV